MPEVTIIHGTSSITVSAEAGRVLDTLLHEHIPSFSSPCAGNHTCGKCLVLTDGAVSPMDEAEQTLLSTQMAQPGFRLACCCKVLGNLTVTVPTKGPSKILSWYHLPESKATEHGVGFAVDIGTTTVAMQLIDRESGQILAERVAENAQCGFGADVISRIEACKTAGLETLSSRIALQLEQLAAECMQECGIGQVEESVITGNTTMLHLYEGLDPSSLAVSPFTVQSFFGCMSRRTLAGAPVYLPRCIGAYVGADITCAVLAADLTKSDVQLLADIGTNGEIVLARSGKLLCCSTAAGPAFEGAGLSRGMPAGAGAIRAVQAGADSVSFQTIGDVSPTGICGSGILDAIAVMLETDAMDSSGYLDEDWEVGSSGILITQKDVRQIQLAKAAVCGGILTLLEAEGLCAEDLDRFVVSGGFGSSMNHASAAAIGLYPEAMKKKAVFLGNGSLGGAAMLLCSSSLREASARMAESAKEISLSASPEFMDHYIDCMSFEAF